MRVASKRRCSTLAMLMTGTILAGAPSAAATLSWPNPATGDWFAPANWSGGALPAAGDKALINIGGTAEATGAAVPTAMALDVGAAGNPLGLGVALAAAADATGALPVGGSVRGIAPAATIGTFVVGQTSGDGRRPRGQR